MAISIESHRPSYGYLPSVERVPTGESDESVATSRRRSDSTAAQYRLTKRQKARPKVLSTSFESRQPDICFVGATGNEELPPVSRQTGVVDAVGCDGQN